MLRIFRMYLVVLLFLVLGLSQGCDSGKGSPTEPKTSDLTNPGATLSESANFPSRPPLGVILIRGGMPDIDVRNVTNLRGGVHYFGDVRVGETGYSFVDIYNVGKGDLVISEVRMNPVSIFYLGSICLYGGGPCSPPGVTFPYSLPPGGILHVFLEFRPLSMGTYCSVRDYLSIKSNDPDEGTVTVGLCGRGI